MDEHTMEDYLVKSRSARDAFTHWETEIQKNSYTEDHDYRHTIQFYFPNEFARIDAELADFGKEVTTRLEPLVRENNLAINLPRIETFNPIGERIDKIVHHPSYVAAGNIIYHTRLLEKMSHAGGLLECLSLLFLSSQTGEAGHNCPIACSAGIIRVLQKNPEIPNKDYYLQKLTSPSYDTHFTGAQFLTEIQGGSDVGLNAVMATHEEKATWRIYGEKWFCSNAGADLIFLTARFDQNSQGTKGLGLFLVPAIWHGKKNHYSLRRLKDKLGTRSMATGEIDFNGAYAFAVGKVEEGIHIVMDNVLHLSRLFNSFCVLGMARRAYTIARAYAQHRVAFAHPIIQYPLVIENLARIKTENAAMIAALFATAGKQDQYDLGELRQENTKFLLRLMVNMMKYLSARWSVEHIHHSLDVLAGNGTIETFSSIPRLLRDCIICENWEGTHNLLRAQIMKDMLKYDIDQAYLAFMQAELAKMKKYSLHIYAIQNELDTLKTELMAFRQQSPALQQLQIQQLVDKMAILYCALMLLQEALDQQKTSKISSKLDCYQYFCLLHIEKQNKIYDSDYLELITRIVS